MLPIADLQAVLIDVWTVYRESPLAAPSYAVCAGCAITMGIHVKFGTAHGGLRPEVGSTKCIDVNGSGGVSCPPVISVLLSKK